MRNNKVHVLIFVCLKGMRSLILTKLSLLILGGVILKGRMEGSPLVREATGTQKTPIRWVRYSY